MQHNGTPLNVCYQLLSEKDSDWQLEKFAKKKSVIFRRDTYSQHQLGVLLDKGN